MNKKVIYTVLVGDVDELIQPEVVDTSFDYICFSDHAADGKKGVWTIKKIDSIISNRTRLSRFPKLLPHRVLPEYDYSLYIDANVVICDAEFYKLVNGHIEKNVLICQLPHPTRDCIYLELEQCVNIRKISPLQYMRLHSYYTKSNMPHHYGLFENNIILRKHGNELVIRISELWWKAYNAISDRDQLSLMPIYHSVGYFPQLLLGAHENSRNSALVRCIQHTRPVCHNLSFVTRICNLLMRECVLPIYRKVNHIEGYSSQW